MLQYGVYYDYRGHRIDTSAAVEAMPSALEDAIDVLMRKRVLPPGRRHAGTGGHSAQSHAFVGHTKLRTGAGGGATACVVMCACVRVCVCVWVCGWVVGVCARMCGNVASHLRHAPTQAGLVHPSTSPECLLCLPCLPCLDASIPFVTTRPDSCIVNKYEAGDCIPPHIDHQSYPRLVLARATAPSPTIPRVAPFQGRLSCRAFLPWVAPCAVLVRATCVAVCVRGRPFCTVSLLSVQQIKMGRHIGIASPGEFSAPFSVALPLGGWP